MSEDEKTGDTLRVVTGFLIPLLFLAIPFSIFAPVYFPAVLALLLLAFIGRGVAAAVSLLARILKRLDDVPKKPPAD